MSDLFVKSLCWWKFLSFYSEFIPVLYCYKDVSSCCNFTLLLLTLIPVYMESCFFSSLWEEFETILPATRFLSSLTSQVLFSRPLLFPYKPLVTSWTRVSGSPVKALVYACFSTFWELWTKVWLWGASPVPFAEATDLAVLVSLCCSCFGLWHWWGLP